MTAVVLRGDARRLPLPDACVDLIVTSPPYFGLRSYTDDGAHYDGQIGSEATPREWLAALVACTREWVRVLKPSGSLFVNLGDKYDAGTNAPRKVPGELNWIRKDSSPRGTTGRPKSLLGLPWRYALACTDELGLILRRDIIWSKPNGLPESVTDRCRSSHEYVFHLVRQPRYYAAVDEIREPQAGVTGGKDRRPFESGNGVKHRSGNKDYDLYNPLGKLPGSVWDIPSQPLAVPAHLGVDHFAAFPMELPRRCVLGWSPPGVCTACGEGRRPVAALSARVAPPGRRGRILDVELGRVPGWRFADGPDAPVRTITGYACACTPYTDHPGRAPVAQRRDYAQGGPGYHEHTTYGRKQAGEYERTGPWREYHLEDWTPPPTRPALVLDPFGGTGTTALVAAAYGRIGIGVDLSGDYCRLARWRTADPGERARALLVPKPPPVPDGQGSLFGDWEAV